jgi:acetolactate synthase small subunit
MTKGKYRVGITFNPSNDDMVGQIKRKAADLIELITLIDGADSPEIARIKALAQTEIEELKGEKDEDAT